MSLTGLIRKYGGNWWSVVSNGQCICVSLKALTLPVLLAWFVNAATDMREVEPLGVGMYE
jgi:hypothetical protein